MADHIAVTPNRWIPSPEIRKYIYRVLVGIGPILALYGVVTDAEFILWLGLAETILGSPVGALALANVPKETIVVPSAQAVEVDPITGL